MEAWQPIPPEELTKLESGQPVVTYTTEWKNGKRLEHFREGVFRAYSECRGIVSVDFPEGYSYDNSFCEASVGRYEIPEHEDLHTVLGGYYED